MSNPGDGGGLEKESSPTLRDDSAFGNEVLLKPGEGGGLENDDPKRGNPGDKGCEKFGNGAGAACLGNDPNPLGAPNPGDKGGSANEPNPGDGSGFENGGGGGASLVGGSGAAIESKDAKPDEG